MTLGVNPGLLGLLLALPLFCASCFGVWFGHLADDLAGRWGRRPFMFLAALVAALSYGFMWMPAPHWNEVQLLWYFGGLSLSFQLAAVVYSVSLNSLVFESSPSSAERTRLLGFTAYFVKMGSLCYQWLYPLTLLSIAGVTLGVAGVGWGLALGVFVGMGLMPVLFGQAPVAIKSVVEGPVAVLAAAPPASAGLGCSGFGQNLGLSLSNPAMVFVLLLTLLQMGGAAYAATMDYYLLVYFVYGGDIAQGAIAKGFLSTAYALVSMLAVPIILALVRALGRLQTLMIIYLVNALGGVAKWFLFVPDIGLWILVDALLCGAVWSAMVIVLPSMVADLAQGATLSRQRKYAASYAAIYGWALSLSGVGVWLCSGFTLSLIGFDATLGGHQPAQSLCYMRLILVLGTLVFSLLALALVWGWRRSAANYQFSD
jgi:glycoside/pentoside/hexuronide:cation symporter, GPH family